MRNYLSYAITPIFTMILLLSCSGSDAQSADKERSSTDRPGLTQDVQQSQQSAQAASRDYSGPKAQGQSQSNSQDEDCTKVIDACPVAGGITWQCKTRFLHGVNYAWHSFGSDFGGIQQWGMPGVSGMPEVSNELADMKKHGSNVVRWWIFADLRGDGMMLDANGTPVGLGGTFLQDLRQALDLAAEHDLYLMLTVFSFDAFRPTKTVSGRLFPGIKSIAVDSAKRQALMKNVIAPMAAAAEASPNRKRLIAWDLINEPEWAMKGPSLHGDPDFEPMSDIEAVSHEEMQTFLADLTATLKANSRALITVGGSAIKWKNAWSKLDLDFYQFHIYDWVHQQWPYHKSPREYGISGKPVVMGEFPLNGLSGITVNDLLTSWFEDGYAGGISWSVTDQNFKWHENKGAHLPFAQTHACETSF